MIPSNHLLISFYDYLVLSIDYLAYIADIVETWLNFLIFFVLYLKCKIKKLEKYNSSLKKSCSNQNCVVCLQEKSSILLMPCKHLCCCQKCFDLMRKKERNVVNKLLQKIYSQTKTIRKIKE
ncbi:E3 ubiquitin- ligase MGRN1 isoform X3 [Brachionus plicatilis]|uniref:E3 ubiquitin-ligase MGRN1 isoform X3 n=1 Tax=Brachionus plicatilis TaxID=10195 RepID=A0A3M7SQQ7_BRAPC|nr:E3 ubiquitin- ligase MGRN1 isoform X3 [Brachionus plicatilis]